MSVDTIQSMRINMKKLLVALSVTLLGSVHATEGHNGIRFDMKKEDLERIGFVCRPSPTDAEPSQVVCNHMDMKGRAFSRNLERYRVTINKEVIAYISASVFEPPRSLEGLMALAQDIKEFYPLEYEFSARFKELAPLTFRYYEPQGSGAQVTYLEYSRSVNITLYPKGSIKP
jgi:hypothetical protein